MLAQLADLPKEAEEEARTIAERSPRFMPDGAISSQVRNGACARR
jgi:hypothetical protein